MRSLYLLQLLFCLFLWSPWAVVLGVADLLFLTGYTGDELNHATAAGYTSDVVTAAQWLTMTTSDFAQYKAIIIGDPYCSGNVAYDPTLLASKQTWADAVTGNIILIGTDPSFHFRAGIAGAGNLLTNGINFVADQPLKTGLYLAFSCVGGIGNVALLSPFGSFSLGSPGASFNMAHIVASSPALGTLSDNDLSNWSLSVHEVWTSFPTTGRYAFQTLVIAEGVTGGGAMTFGDGTSGVPYILSLGATPAGCGDGIYQPSLGEECDDGNTVSGDGCSASCKCETGTPNGAGGCNAPVCGDGRYAPAAGEQCDDGNTISGDGCSSTCQCESGLPDGSGGCLPARCGDGVYSAATEQCDDGNTVSGDGCSSTCQCEVGIPDRTGGCEPPRCGDGLFYPASEQCDDGNLINGDGCSSTCKCEVGLPNGSGGCDPPACGDGVYDSATEQCDDGNNVSGDGCSATCTCEVGLPNGEGGCEPPTCGDGIYDPENTEQCDDGNLVNGDGCSSTCKCEVGLPNGEGGCDPPVCGDGVFDAATEQCDDGNTISGDGCSSTCECELGLPDGHGGCLAPVCGDGILTPSIGEQCDDGNLVNGDGCSSTCKCEFGLPNGTPSCAPPVCGDGVYSPATGEQCDDGNLVSGDGCSSTCQCEFGLPNGDGTCALPVCGDGIYAPETEQCDPGIVTTGGSVCSSTCTCTVGLPDGSGGCLASVCGDGVFNPLTEFCDDGNLINGDGCSANCTCEVGAPDGHGGCLAPRCGDGIYQPQDGEQCDGVAVLGCSSTCQCLFSTPNGLGGCLAPTCGDGIYQPELGEQCDDGNTVDGDGCSSSCQCELGMPDGMGGCTAYNMTSTSTISTSVVTISSSSTTDLGSTTTSGESTSSSSSATSSGFIFTNSSSISSTSSTTVTSTSSPPPSLSSSTTALVSSPSSSNALISSPSSSTSNTVILSPPTSSGPSTSGGNDYFIEVIVGVARKRQSTLRYAIMNADGTVSVTSTCQSASMFHLEGGLLTHDGAIAFASNADVSSGSGPLRLAPAASGITLTFSNANSVLTWSNPAFGNPGVVFAVNTVTSLVEAFYTGNPPAGFSVVSLRLVATTTGLGCAATPPSATTSLSVLGSPIRAVSSLPLSAISKAPTVLPSVLSSGIPIPHQGYVGGILMNPIVGIEIVVQVNITTSTIYAGLGSVTSICTSTCGSQINPIYNTPLPGVPCYVCQMMQEGVSCPTNTHFTLTTVACTACAGGQLPTPVPITYQTCLTCPQATLTGAPNVPAGTAPSYPGGQSITMTMNGATSVATAGYAQTTGSLPGLKSNSTTTVISALPIPTKPTLSSTQPSVFKGKAATRFSTSVLALVCSSLLAAFGVL